jgi:hypothetical protein
MKRESKEQIIPLKFEIKPRDKAKGDPYALDGIWV